MHEFCILITRESEFNEPLFVHDLRDLLNKLNRLPRRQSEKQQNENRASTQRACLARTGEPLTASESRIVRVFNRHGGHGSRFRGGDCQREGPRIGVPTWCRISCVTGRRYNVLGHLPGNDLFFQSSDSTLRSIKQVVSRLTPVATAVML